jgi:SAM-dependent methyltransferase
MDPKKLADFQSSYDLLAEEYAARIYDELKGKPLDRELLDRFATRLHRAGRVCDLGCGPGHVARYIYDRGVDVFGLDLSPKMVEQARKLNPGIEFRQGNMLLLDAKDAAWSGALAFYSIIHIPRIEVPRVLSEICRVLKPGALLFLAFHLGQQVEEVQDLWGKRVCLEFTFFERSEMERYLRDAGYSIEESLERDPYPDVEVQTRRAYILAKKSMLPRPLDSSADFSRIPACSSFR